LGSEDLNVGLLEHPQVIAGHGLDLDSSVGLPAPAFVRRVRANQRLHAGTEEDDSTRVDLRLVGEQRAGLNLGDPAVLLGEPVQLRDLRDEVRPISVSESEWAQRCL
jgi:hypothetical protein